MIVATCARHRVGHHGAGYHIDLFIDNVGCELPRIRFVDIAQSAGLNQVNTSGGKARKNYILETTGNGAAIFDFDGDGFNDVLVVNGTRLKRDARDPPATVQLHRNDGKGHFTEQAAAREAIWTPDKEKPATETKLWTPGSKEPA